MKKSITRWMSALLALGLTACGSVNTTSGVATAASTAAETVAAEETSVAADTEQSEESTTDSASENTTDTGNVLVVYYSASGHTERVANDIAEAAGADLYEIVPTEVYTDEDLDWTNSDSRVSREHDDESLRDVELVSTEVPNWDTYDTVFIGYPIWWGIAAWPVNGFVSANDFTGKTVIPFATSSSSGMGQSGSLLEELAGTGDWQEGQRFSSGASTEDVQTWGQENF